MGIDRLVGIDVGVSPAEVAEHFDVPEDVALQFFEGRDQQVASICPSASLSAVVPERSHVTFTRTHAVA